MYWKLISHSLRSLTFYPSLRNNKETMSPSCSAIPIVTYQNTYLDESRTHFLNVTVKSSIKPDFSWEYSLFSYSKYFQID